MPRQASAEAVKFPRANRRSRWSSVWVVRRRW